LVREGVKDQLRYAVFNGFTRPSEAAEYVPVGASLAERVISEMVEDGALVEKDDSRGTFLSLPDGVSASTTTEAEITTLHAKAREAWGSAPEHGDSTDKLARMESVMTDDESGGKKPSTTERPGDDTVAGPEASSEDVAESMAEHGGMLPVDRDYNWDENRLDPDTVAEYVEADTEYSDMMAEIEDRRKTGKLPRFRWTGPTGCGKTTAGENVAVDMDAPCFIVECHDGLRPNNLLGMPTYVGDQTWWVDGPITKALIASQDQPVVLIFDEVNRTTSRTLGVIMSALDHRSSVTLNARGGETVEGNAENLITFATMNEGDNYVVNNIDVAQLRRFGNTFEADYIGQYDLDREAQLVSERTPVSHDVATEMIRAANAIRDQADRQKSQVSMGLPTSSVLDWARTAYSYRDSDPEGGPLMKAAHRTFLNTFYSGDDFDTVRTAVESHVRGMELSETDTTDDSIGVAEADDDAYDTSIDVADDSYLLCEACGYFEEVAEADDEVAMTMKCPDCSDPLTPKEAR
jgi:nitric oxide reductase NorQ protein